MHHRTVLPHILIGLCALFVLVLFALNGMQSDSQDQQTSVVETTNTGSELAVTGDLDDRELPEVSNQEYESWLKTWLENILAANGQEELEGLRTELFDVTVPTAYKPIHLDLVFLMQQVSTELSADQRAQLEQFNEQF